MRIGKGFRKIGRGFKKVGRGFKKLARVFRKLFLVLFGREALGAFQRAALLLLRTQLGRIVWAVVEAVDLLKVEGEAKRREAFRRILREAKAAGLEVKDSLINLLIEVAVQRLKGLVPRSQAR
ncbi:MAG: phage holin, LLH family [Terriglobia bacterium]